MADVAGCGKARLVVAASHKKIGNQRKDFHYKLSRTIVDTFGIKATLVPRWLAVWGFIGYAISLVGMLSEIMGSGLGLASSLPGGLWAVCMGVWLIVKGFTTPKTVPCLTL